jgi:hypothetical protein
MFPLGKASLFHYFMMKKSEGTAEWFESSSIGAILLSTLDSVCSTNLLLMGIRGSEGVFLARDIQNMSKFFHLYLLGDAQ